MTNLVNFQNLKNDAVFINQNLRICLFCLDQNTTFLLRFCRVIGLDMIYA